MEYKCSKCNNSKLFFTEKKNIHKGLYCAECGAFIKWLGKNEYRLLKHESL